MNSQRRLSEKVLLFREIFRTLMTSVKEAEGILSLSRSPEALAARNLVARRCVQNLLAVVGATVSTSGAEISTEPTLFVGNHSSYLDIPVLYSQVAVSLVARNDVRYWPVFGKAAEVTDVIFIKRGQEGARKERVKAAIVESIRQGKSVGVFPEGGTSLRGRHWKLGALALAQSHQIPVQPFRIRYQPERLCAYIDKDNFVAHLWNLLSERQLLVSIEFGERFYVTDFERDTKRLERWASQGFGSDEALDLSSGELSPA